MLEQQLNLKEYIAMIWFRMSELPENRSTQDFTLFELSGDGFECYYTNLDEVVCESNSRGKYELDDLGLRPYNWYQLTVKSLVRYSEVFIGDLGELRFSSEDSNRFFPFGYDMLATERIYIGIGRNKR